jgi:hypothetical protein
VQSFERIVHGKESCLDFARVVPESFLRHQPGRSAPIQCPANETVSVMTRSAYGDEQFAGLNSP